MPPMDNKERDELSGLRVELAELRVDVRHLTHDIKNLRAVGEQLTNTIVTRREHDEHLRRTDKLEVQRDKIVWSIVAAWLAGLGVVFKKWM